MEAIKRGGRRARRWAQAVVLGTGIAAGTMLSACQVRGERQGDEIAGAPDDDPIIGDGQGGDFSPHDDPSDLPPPADPDTCVCTDVAPFGFHGPSIVGRGPTLADIHCPKNATLPGFSGFATATGQWARECLITPIPACTLSGQVCGPPPPEGFSFCIYRGEDFPSCPDGYSEREPMIEAIGNQLLQDVTLCCSNPRDPG